MMIISINKEKVEKAVDFFIVLESLDVSERKLRLIRCRLLNQEDPD